MISLGWIAEALTRMRRVPGLRVGFGMVESVSIGGEDGVSRVRRRAFIVAILKVF